MAAIMWKNSLKNVESDNNKILFYNLLDFFLQRNGSYFLNKPRTLWRIKPCAYVLNESESKSFGLKENSRLVHLHVT